MSSPAASWALITQATASRYCSRKIDSPIADLNERPCRLSVNQSGRGYEPVMAVGSIRSRVTLSIRSLLGGRPARGRSAFGPHELAIDPVEARRAAHGHGGLELVSQNIDYALDAGRAVHGEAPHVGPTDQDGP